MKKRVIIILFGLWFCHETQILAGSVPRLVSVQASHLYIPTGFDSNDPNIQVALEGYFPNTCYKIGPPIVTTDSESKKISIQPRAYFFDGICLQVIVRFNQVVDLGLLASGKYGVAVGNISKALDVTLATNKGPDDYLYAPVEKVNFEPSGKKLTITGSFQADCFKKATPIIYDPKDHVIAILPIADHVKHEGDCVLKKKPFTYEVDLSDKGIRGRALIHVRSQNGYAFNLIEDFE